MQSKLAQIETALCDAWGEELLRAAPELPYLLQRILLRWGRTPATLPELWQQLDSALFNAIYVATERKMTVVHEGAPLRITTDAIRDMADRLLSLAYSQETPTNSLKDALFDLSRCGSYAAMRELVRRYPLDAEEREAILRILSENGQEA